MKRFLVAGGVLMSLALLGGEASAQTGTARGKVVDEKDQAIEGVVITLDYQGGVTRKNETKTNKKGEFTQVGLAPGTYLITAKKEGLQTATMEQVRLPYAEIAKPGVGMTGNCAERLR